MKKLGEYKITGLGLVSSFEATFASDPSKSREIQKTILDITKEYDVYTLNESLVLRDPNNEQWIELSTIYAIGYIASLLLDTGLFIQMNSASTVIAAVRNHHYVSIDAHKSSSGEALWIGALLAPLYRIIGQGLIFGHYYNLTPYGAHTDDILNILFPDKFKRALHSSKASDRFLATP